MILLLKAYTFQSLDQSTDERPPHKKRKIITSPSVEELHVCDFCEEAFPTEGEYTNHYKFKQCPGMKELKTLRAKEKSRKKSKKKSNPIKVKMAFDKN